MTYFSSKEREVYSSLKAKIRIYDDIYNLANYY